MPSEPLRRIKKYAGALIGQQNGQMVAVNGSTGDVLAVPAVVPQKRSGSGKRVLFVNGINTAAADALHQSQEVADQMGASVINVHVATDNLFPQVVVDGVHPMGTFTGDGLRALEAHADLYNDPASKSLSRAVLRLLDSNQPVNILAHSMGGLVTASGITQAEAALAARGLSNQQVMNTMQRVNILTIGSAENHNVPGPIYKNLVSNTDPVANLLGLGSPGATPQGPVQRIPAAGDPLSSHILEHYLPYISF